MTYFDQADLTRLDSILHRVEHEARDNDDLVNSLAKFSLRLTGDVSEILRTDPYSDLYIERIRSVHREIIGKEHSSQFEGLPELNLEYELQWPYPWGTKSPETVGRLLIAYGYLIRAANLPSSARVLEVGCGLGSLTWNLARMGYRVDAIDPNPRQCESVSAFTKDFPVRPNVIAATLDQWLSDKSESYKYDAVIFFESFHHLTDHQKCLETLLSAHMEPDGKVVLAAEPVFEKTGPLLPYPWGPRLDGESLRAMRRWGWIELGFTKAYLEGLLRKCGLQFEWFRSDVAFPHSHVLIGSRPPGQPDAGMAAFRHFKSRFSDGIDFSKDGLPDFVADCSGLSHVEPWGRWSEGDQVRIMYARKLPSRFILEIRLASVFGPNTHEKMKIKVGDEECEAVLETIESRSLYRFSLRSVDADSILIVVPNPFRPKDIPELQNEDARQLGIGIRSIVIV